MVIFESESGLVKLQFLFMDFKFKFLAFTLKYLL